MLKVDTKNCVTLTDKSAENLKHTRKLLKARLNRLKKKGTSSGEYYDSVVADIAGIDQYQEAKTTNIPIVPTASVDTVEDLSMPPMSEDNTEDLSTPE